VDASPLLLRSVPAAQEAGFELEETERELAPRAEPFPVAIDLFSRTNR
jgi:hypothetical protein